MKKLVLPLFFLGLGTFAMAGCGDQAKENAEGDQPQSQAQPEQQDKPHTVAKPALSLPESEPVEEGLVNPPVDAAPVFTPQPESVENSAPAFEEESPFDKPVSKEPASKQPASDESAVEPPVSEDEEVDQPEFGIGPPIDFESSEVPADDSVPSDEPSVDADADSPADEALFQDAPADGTELSSDPFGKE